MAERPAGAVSHVKGEPSASSTASTLWTISGPMPSPGIRVAGMGVMGTAEKGRKQFFFEKKNQKTFGPAVAEFPTACTQGDKSFLVLFSKKNRLPYFAVAITGRNCAIPCMADAVSTGVSSPLSVCAASWSWPAITWASA